VADARLRRAYAHAEHAGVSRATLVDYHAEWSRLRHRASSNPNLVATRYEVMASDLNRLAARPRHGAPSPQQPGPWRRFRMEVASLWR
jgi:hypothetical protein